jgi:CO/xanthine dehydrogenase Mo-binding subunit
MIAIVAAHAMGVPVERVKVEWPDTAHGLNFEGSSAQRTTVHMGNAVKNACDALKREIVDAAIQLRGGTPDDWRCEVGRVWLGDESWAYEEVIGGFTTAPSFEGHVELKGLGSYSYAPSEDKAFGGLDHWAPGAATAEVEVDLATGEITLTKVAVVADTGKVLHLGSARGQVEGGAVMGIGLALNEELVYSDGALQNGDALQYRLPMMHDIPEDFTTDLIENGDGPGPFGSKGMAQTSIPCLTPAINNAIRDAIGVHLTSAPLTPEKVLRALGKLPGKAR